MGKLTRMLETWIDSQTLAALCYLIDIILIAVVAFVLILLLVGNAHGETCYECGKRFVPSVYTPMRTRGWDKPFCSEGCKVDYRMSRI